MIHRETTLDALVRHDVAMVRMEQKSKDSVFEEISREVLKKNPFNPVFIHDSFDPIPPHRVHVASFIIVTTDIENQVNKSLTFSETFNCIVLLFCSKLSEHF